MKHQENQTIAGKLLSEFRADESKKSKTLASVVLDEVRRMQKELQPSVFRQKPK